MNPSSAEIKNMSVCFVHDWLVAMRGGEKVLEAMAELFPKADIYTLFCNRKNLSPLLQKRKIYTSFLQYIPGIFRFYRWFLPLFPIAIHFLNIRKYDLVISSSHCVAKAARTNGKAVHICYCHTPMRYLWGFHDEYFERFPPSLRRFIDYYFKWLRKWDVAAAQNVTIFIANSENTADKISKFYGKKATIIHPPVDVPSTALCRNGLLEGERYFLIVSALVPYKRIEIAVEAFNRLERPLKIVGDGPLMPWLRKLVRFHKIEFEGWLNQDMLWDRYANCRALIFPGEEDFGIVPVEAQMFGKPVIAYGKGGVTETVLAESTGLFFYEQEPEVLAKLVAQFDQFNFDAVFIQRHAQKFNRERFQREIKEVIEPYVHA